jgi:hypothetical protein
MRQLIEHEKGMSVCRRDARRTGESLAAQERIAASFAKPVQGRINSRYYGCSQAKGP